MCGIAGIFNLHSTQIDFGTIKTFTDSLSHRGPDGYNYSLLNNNTVALGHRRLSILDLSVAGTQPMSWKNRYTITYNGEVFNFIEIRNELLKEGFKFETQTDTEIILASFEKWGRDCFHKFNGMWAMAIYDSETKKLLLCRDRFGVKPLYFTFSPKQQFAFASETYAFKFLNNFKLSCNEDMISRGMNNPVMIEGSGYTIWNNVFQLLAGHFIEIDNETTNIEQKRWFAIPQKTTTLSYEDAKEEFFNLLQKSVQLRTRSDVPIASALSGGLDSSSVYSMLYHLKSQNLNSERSNLNKIKGFVATFENTIQDETDYATSVVEFCNGEAEFIPTDFSSIISNIESSTKLFNDITATPISVLGDVYKSMRKNNYVVSLDGHGVDEMMYGYRSLVSMAISQSVIEMNVQEENDLIETYIQMFLPQFKEEEKQKLDKRLEQFKNLLSLNSSAGKLKFKLKQKIKKLINNNPVYFEFSNNLNNRYLNKNTVNSIDNLSDKAINLGNYNYAERELAIDFYYRNIPYNMRDFDRAAMQHGVEIRMPFMDYNLVNFVFSLPMNYKVGGGFTKRILRDSMKNLLPEKIYNRKLKIGMGAPLHDWFNMPLNSYILDTVHSQKFTQNNLWNAKKVQELVSDKCSKKNWNLDEAQQFWNILNAHIILS